MATAVKPGDPTAACKGVIYQYAPIWAKIKQSTGKLFNTIILSYILNVIFGDYDD